jgi:hypothetical protein
MPLELAPDLWRLAALLEFVDEGEAVVEGLVELVRTGSSGSQG